MPALGRNGSDMPTRASQNTTVIILLEVSGLVLGLPIAVVRDALRVCRVGRGAGWRVRGAPPERVCDDQSIDVDGRLIPLVDLGTSLGLAGGVPPAARARSVVVVQTGERWLGLLVDTVGEIVEVPREAIEAASCAVARGGATGQVARLGDRAIGLLDADALVPAEGRLTVA